MRCSIPRRLALRVIVFCAVSALALAAAAFAADPPPNPRFTGAPLMRVWTQDDYGALPVNHSVLQHPQTGLIYAANNGGVLEYDGVRWHHYPLPGGGQVRAVAVDGRGRIWWLGGAALGRLEPTDNGTYRAVALTERLPPGALPLGYTLEALAADHGIYFASRRKLIHVPEDDSASVRVWPLPAQLTSLCVLDGAVHVTLADGQRLRASSAELVSAARDQPAVFAADARWWLTPRGPLPRAGNTLHATEIPHGDTAECARVLADGRLAFGTSRSGLLLFDQQGRLVQRIDRTLGLPANRVQGLWEDREGGVWLALHSGIARLQLDSPFVLHGATRQLHGTPHAVHRVDGRLFVAHSEGLSAANSDGVFSGLTGSLGALMPVLRGAEPVFAAAALARGVSSGDPETALDHSVFNGFVALSGETNRFIVGAADGAWLCATEGSSWRRLRQIEGIPGVATAYLEAPRGLVWIMSRGQGLWRVDFRGGSEGALPVKRFRPGDNMPAGVTGRVVRFMRLGDTAVISLGGELFRYDAAAERFIPETRIAGWTSDGISPDGVAASCTDETGALWVQLGPDDRRVLRIAPDGPDRWRATPAVTGLPQRVRTNSLYHDAAAQTLWVAGPRGLVSTDLAWKATHPPAPLTAIIRRLAATDGTVLAARTHPATAAAAGLALGAGHTGLRAEFAATTYVPAFHGEGRPQFRTRLQGLETEWTPWTREPFREFTNLPWRSFVLQLQARDTAGRQSDADTLAFALAAPWWATRGAFAGYVVLAGCGIAGLVRVRTSALRRRAERLEEVVAARTTELATKNTELTRLHRLELDEKTSARLAEEKTRLEMLRYQLNPHFLANSLAALRTMVGPQAAGARQMIERLAAFCRMALTRRDETATVRDEIEMLRAYLDTEKSRWREMLEIAIETEPAALEVALPPFLLLPLVENAIKYGGQTSADKLSLRLTFAREGDGTLRIEIANTGRWIPPEQTGNTIESGHIGLENLRQRLRRHYPDAHAFTTTEENGWVVARLTLSLSSFSLSFSSAAEPRAPAERER